MKFLKNKVVAAATAILIVAVILTLIFGKTDPFSRGVKFVFSPVLTLASNVTQRLASYKAYFMQVDAYKAENERLTRENTELKERDKNALEYRKENERLLGILNLADSEKNFNTVAARVVSYEPNNWYDTIIINKGTADGIKIDDTVISTDGLVGKISDIGINWAQISSVINRGNAIASKVSRTGEIAVTEGDRELGEQKLCKLTFINSAAQMAEGDLIETSGAVGIYPEGLKIGTIKEMTVDTNGTKYGIVEPSVDFENLYEVLVIK